MGGFQKLITGCSIVFLHMPVIGGTIESKDKSGIQERAFGELPTGEAVRLYTLTNESGLSFSVMDWGATLISVKAPDRDGSPREVTLGFDTLDEYIAGHPLMGSTVGRFANRIAGGGFTIDGVRFDLETVNGKGIHIHGGKTGFAKQMWEFVEGSDTELVLRLVSLDGHEGYPGEVEVTARYAFTAPDTLSLIYGGTTTKPTHLNLTNHVYWNLEGRGSGSILDHRLEIDAERVLETEDQVPNGSLNEVAGTAFDFRKAHRVGEMIDQVGKGYDHYFFRPLEGNSPRFLAELTAPQSGISLKIATNQAGGQLYTGNYLKPPYAPHEGVCLETQQPPNAPNESAFPSTLLRPGEIYEARTDYTFGLADE